MDKWMLEEYEKMSEDNYKKMTKKQLIEEINSMSECCAERYDRIRTLQKTIHRLLIILDEMTEEACQEELEE
jgi:ribosomal protein S2